MTDRDQHGSHPARGDDEGSDASGDTGSADRSGLRPGASAAEIELEVARTREEFAATLDAIEDMFDVPAHARRLTAGVKRRFADDPAKVVAPAVAGVAGIAAIVAGIIKSRR